MLLTLLPGFLTQDNTQLGIEDPRVLGPLAAFVFAVFIFEIVTPGKAYKRLQVENEKMREMLARLIPVSEEMLAVTKQTLVVLANVTRALEDFLDWWADDGRERRHR